MENILRVHIKLYIYIVETCRDGSFKLLLTRQLHYCDDQEHHGMEGVKVNKYAIKHTTKVCELQLVLLIFYINSYLCSQNEGVHA